MLRHAASTSRHVMALKNKTEMPCHAVSHCRFLSSSSDFPAEVESSSSPTSSSLSSTSSLRIFDALHEVTRRVKKAASKRNNNFEDECLPCIVAMSNPLFKREAASQKQTISDIIDCYSAGQRHFGETFDRDLYSKSWNADIRSLCPDIKWHFLGPVYWTPSKHSQEVKNKSNVKFLMNCRNLFMLESLQSVYVVNQINGILRQSKRREKLNVMVQINTSVNKSEMGVSPGSEAVSLTNHILQNGSHLNLKGFMTIGGSDHDSSTGPNPDYIKLMETRECICRELNLQPEDYELSMGMSGDFEHAIEMGSNNVRIGTPIFGGGNVK